MVIVIVVMVVVVVMIMIVVIIVIILVLVISSHTSSHLTHSKFSFEALVVEAARACHAARGIFSSGSALPPASGNLGAQQAGANSKDRCWPTFAGFHRFLFFSSDFHDRHPSPRRAQIGASKTNIQ